MFEEYTEAEKGFGKVWAERIEPGLSAYVSEYARKKKLAVWGAIGTGVSVLLIYVYFTFIAPWTHEDAQVILLATLLIGGVLLAIGLAYPHTKLEKAYNVFLQETVADHMGDLLVKPQSDEKARAVEHVLSKMGMIEKHGTPDYTNHHIGTYRDCALNIFNLEVTSSSGSGSNRSTSSKNYWIMEVGVPMAFEGEVQIRRDYGAVLNKARSLMVKGKQVPFEHADFEKKFEVYAEDAELAYRLISPAFCDNLLALDGLLPRAMFGSKRPISGLFQNANFILVVEGLADMFETDSVAPAQVEQAARRIIARMNLPMQIIDYLHGDRSAD